MVDDRVGARIALALEQCSEALVADHCPGLEFAHTLANAERGEHALRQCIDRRDQQLRSRLAGL